MGIKLQAAGAIGGIEKTLGDDLQLPAIYTMHNLAATHISLMDTTKDDYLLLEKSQERSFNWHTVNGTQIFKGSVSLHLQ